MTEKLPCDECKGKCCTFPSMTVREFKTIRKKYGFKGNKELLNFGDQNLVVLTALDGSGNCPYLKDGACSVYDLRPKACKAYGEIDSMPCQYLFPKKAMREIDKMTAAGFGKELTKNMII